MSCGGRPPSGFGAAAAAGGRSLRGDFGGTKSATRTSTMVNIKTETDDGNLEVLQESQMQNENKDASPPKGPYKRFHVDATKVASPGINASNTLLHPCKKHKGLVKDGKLEDNESATGLRPPTPIDLFEDECVFCHSFRTSEMFHGPMVLYRDGRIVSSNEGNQTNTIYVHEKCMYWAPQVYFNGDIIVNMEDEIIRASSLKCSRCRLPGAALGCYRKSCRKTYHVPCALMMIPRCHWDVDNQLVLCPNHASDRLPCDERSSPIMESVIPSPILQNQYLDKQGMAVNNRREDQQVDQPNTSCSSYLPQGQGQCLDKEGISAKYRREEQQTNHSRTPVNQWDLPCSVLSASEKVSPKDFASLTSSTVAEEWDKNVTHVPVSGIVDCFVEPIPAPKTCLAEPIPGPEISYEVTSIDGPKKGRAGAAEVAPKLFSGLYFCISAYMKPEDTRNIKNVIAAAEGQVLEGMSPHSLQESLDKNPAKKVYFVYASSGYLDLGKEIDEAVKYRDSGAQWTGPFYEVHSTSSTLAQEWDKNVTHVIVGRSAGRTSCGRSYEVLMAILSGKWVVTAEWIVDCLPEPIPAPRTCLAEPIPGPELSYEVTSINGPKKGRAGAAEVAPKLFSGLYFCLSAYMNPEARYTSSTLQPTLMLARRSRRRPPSTGPQERR